MKVANSPTTKTADMVITRIFDAPRELVWRAWTEAEHLMRWWGPRGFTSPTCKIDLRVGGQYLFCMRSEEGQEYYTTGIYQKIDPLHELVYTDSLADENGNVVPPSYYGMDTEFPLELEVVVTFEDYDGKTKMTLKQTSLPVSETKNQAEAGWSEAFDKLAESLSQEAV